MISTFTGLYTAVRGLYSSQAALTVTSNNISNTDTDGYSRQKVNQTTNSPSADYNGKAIIGTGALVTSVNRVRDPLLDKKYWYQNGSLGEWGVKSSALTEVEEVLNESDNSFSTVMDDFYSALDDLSNNAGDSSARTTVMEAGKTVCTFLNDAAERLSSLQNDANTAVKTTVTQINAFARQIADLNGQIQQAKVSGTAANDLEDQRDLLIDKLSALTEVTVSETTIGMNGTTLSVTVNGSTLISGKNANPLECHDTSDGLYGVRWKDTNETFDPGSGELKGYLDLRDGTGSGTEYQGIPYYMNQLNDFARTFAEAFNEGVYKDGASYYSGHAGGYGADGSTGTRFFTYDGLSTEAFLASGSDMESQYVHITAANISISSDVQDNVDKIAASTSINEADNNENITDLISLCQDNRMFNKGTPEDFMNSIISAVGNESAYAKCIYENKTTTVKNVGDDRTSVSGVSTNEESANLTKYQQTYNANAKIVTMWNELYEATIDMVNN